MAEVGVFARGSQVSMVDNSRGSAGGKIACREGEALVGLEVAGYNTFRRSCCNAALIMRGVGVFCTPRSGACKPGTGTGFSSGNSGKYGTLRRTSFLRRGS